MRIKIVFKSHYKEVNEQNNYIQKKMQKTKTNHKKFKKEKKWHLEN